MELFLEFIDRKQREGKKHLEIISEILKKEGFNVTSHVDNEEPYLFVQNKETDTSFGGIRIYEIGNMVAYRVQKREKTHPYGMAYRLDMEGMFNDFMSENMSEEDAGKKVMESLTNEISKFFKKSAKAESEMRDQEKDGLGLIVKTGGTDYASTLLNKM